MIQLDINRYFNKLKVSKNEEEFLTLGELNEDEIDAHINEVVNYLKIHSQFDNIKAIIREYENDRDSCEKTTVHLYNQSRKVKMIGRKLSVTDLLMLTEFILDANQNIKLDYSRPLSNYKISESFIYDLMRIVELKQSKLSRAINQLQEFLSTEKRVKDIESPKFTNPEIAMAYRVLGESTKGAEYNITEKNAGKILNKYSNDHKSVKVFLRSVNDNKNIENMKACEFKMMTAATKKRNSLFRVQELISIIDNKNVKASNHIAEIIKAFSEKYNQIKNN